MEAYNEFSFLKQANQTPNKPQTDDQHLSLEETKRQFRLFANRLFNVLYYILDKFKLSIEQEHKRINHEARLRLAEGLSCEGTFTPPLQQQQKGQPVSTESSEGEKYSPSTLSLFPSAIQYTGFEICKLLLE